MNDQRQQYDRELLLFGAKRNAVLELSEVQRYGLDSYGDTDYVSIYGLKPADWYGRGIRLLARTAVECTRDRLADLIGRDVAATPPVPGHAPDAGQIRSPAPATRFIGCCATSRPRGRRL
jgi:hypothetical protein